MALVLPPQLHPGLHPQMALVHAMALDPPPPPPPFFLPPWNPCPYRYCNDPWHPPPAFPGHPVNRARWQHNRNPCCDWCMIFQDIFTPGFIDHFLDIYPEHHNRIHILTDRFNRLHWYFASRDRGSWYMSKRVNKLSRLFNKWSNNHFELLWLKPLADRLYRFQDELQVGPHREWYHVMPHPPHWIAP